ncbi:MAG: aldo/keto reductase, partial [Acidobacteriota bacterium]|nr:aldo/keto reductase [Acidobacteriota bacterium]
MIPETTLRNGISIPQLGFGTWLVSQEDAADVVSRALQVGYRHIDTAQGYGNEKGIGAAIAASGIDRGELFLTSKLNNDKHAPADVASSFELTLNDLGTDY